MEKHIEKIKDINYNIDTTNYKNDGNCRNMGKNKGYIKIEFWEKLKIAEKTEFNLSRIAKEVKGRKLNINNYEDLYDELSKLDVAKFLGVKKLDTFFPCLFFEKRYAWVSCGNDGHFRYFSKRKDKGSIIAFDFIDLLEMCYKVPTSQAVENAIVDFGIRFMEDEWMNKMNMKYLSNLTVIHQAKKLIMPQYPELYEYIKNHLKVLETLNVIGNINVRGEEYSYEGNNIFFASNKYISDFISDTDVSSETNKILNLFAVLGFIKKVPEAHIPGRMLHESKSIAIEKKLGNIVNYYTMPPMIDVLPEANEKLKVMKNHNITYFNISKSRIAFAFGEEFANTIYVQNNKTLKIHQELCVNVQKGLEKNFVSLVESNGFTTKNLVIRRPIKSTTPKQRAKELDKIWKGLIVRLDLEYMKPTKDFKEKFKLETDEYVACKRAIM